MKTVRIEDQNDGFSIIVCDGETETRFHFDQEDTREKMTDVFQMLDIESEYELVY